MKLDCEINRLEYSIVRKIYQLNYKNRFNSGTITEIMESAEGKSATRMTMYRKLQKLVKLGYIAKGAIDDHADTYYITENGIKLIEDVTN